MRAVAAEEGGRSARGWLKLSSMVAGLLLLAYIGQGVAFLRANSQTLDEAVHLAAGYSYLATGDFRLNPEDPPLIKLLAAACVSLRYRLPFAPDEGQWAVPDQWKIGQQFLYGSAVPADGVLAAARLPNFLLGIALVGLVGWWAYRLWGRAAGLVALALAALEPNLVAHACLVTTDLGVALFTCLTLYLLWEYLARPSGWWLAAAGLAAGLALATKFSAIFLPQLAGILLVGQALFGTTPLFSWPRRNWGDVARLAGAALSLTLLICFAALVLWAVYLGHGLAAWWQGLDWQLAHQDRGHPAFFLGDYSQGGWWAYLPVAFLLKTPLGSLLLVGASLVLCRAGRPLRWREAAFLLLPVAALFVAATQARVNIGLRYLLPVYPLLYVQAGRLATVCGGHRWLFPVLLVGALGWTAVSSGRVAPHQLAYFNELAGGPTGGQRYLGDSNLDWGQDLKNLKAYMDRERLAAVHLCYFGTAPPDYYGIRYQRIPGAAQLAVPPDDRLPTGAEPEVLAISVGYLQGTHLDEKGRFHWLRQRLPVARIGYSIYVYDLTRDTDARILLAEDYSQHGEVTAAVNLVRKVLAAEPSNARAKQLLDWLAQWLVREAVRGPGQAQRQSGSRHGGRASGD